MLIRLAWDWLGRWHEPLVVGAAVTLGGLASWAPPLPIAGATTGGQPPIAASPRHEREPAVTARVAPSRPGDTQYYRELWARDAQAFYSRHRSLPAQTHEATEMWPVAAVASAHADGPEAVAQAYHREVTPAVPSQPATGLGKPAGQPASDTLGERRLGVATCLAAGMLASLVFAALWPAGGSRPVLAVGKDQAADDPAVPSPLAGKAAAAGEVIALAIPTAWIQVRPTTSQILRRVVLTGSYLGAALSGWLLFA